MTTLSNLEYLRLNKWHKFLYKLQLFFCAIPGWFLNLFKKIGRFFKRFGIAVKDNVVDIFVTFKKGSWKTRLSYLIMGFGSVMYGNWLRGLLFFLMEAVFILYMILAGAHWLSMFGGYGPQKTLGVAAGSQQFVEKYQVYMWVEGDDSFRILLYGLITILFMVALVYTWRLNIKQCRICEEIIASGHKVKSPKDDVKSLVDNDFHKTLMALPTVGIVVFTVMPIIFMILVAFTNYDVNHDGYANLFSWVGFDNFNSLVSFGNGGLGYAFGEILAWTLIWAFFATFSNYFLGMFVAMMINKKGIKFKKVWRTILVMTIAIPQFISLMYVSNLFAKTGVVNGMLIKWGWIDTPIGFWESKHLARAMVIIINIWIGIPYLMLITTGILMNIPEDMYESSRIDGANAFQQYLKITLPYMLFVTGPYLLTSFTGNINNFNVIFLLTGGKPTNPKLSVNGQGAGDTDLLITWLFNLTTGATGNYKLASVIGIMIFLVVAVLSLVVFNLLPSNKNEEEFS